MSRDLEDKLGIPAGFGGLTAFWHPEEHRAVVLRCGEGNILELMTLTPLNAVQLEKIAHALVEIGKAEGHITSEHLAQAEKLPTIPVAEYDREYSDRVTGGD